MSDSDEALDLFQEPDGFYKPEPEPTQVVHRMLDGRDLSLRLVGHNPLWGHLLWNAGRTLADYLESSNATLVKDKSVLELGAGAGLPSIICAIHGAAQVVVTDYPDAELIENLQHNIDHCELLPEARNIYAHGYLWGAPTDNVAIHLEPPDSGFDLLILADLLFNHSEHRKLVSTVQKTLRISRDALALVCFTPYRPWLLEKDLAFFDIAKESGFAVEKLFEKVMDKVMFEDDPGDETLRRTVYAYSMKWQNCGSSEG